MKTIPCRIHRIFCNIGNIGACISVFAPPFSHFGNRLVVWNIPQINPKVCIVRTQFPNRKCKYINRTSDNHIRFVDAHTKLHRSFGIRQCYRHSIFPCSANRRLNRSALPCSGVRFISFPNRHNITLVNVKWTPYRKNIYARHFKV